MTSDDLNDPDYLTGMDVAPSVKRARVIEVLETVNEACSSRANDQAYDVWIDRHNNVVDSEDTLNGGTRNLAQLFKASSSKLHDMIAILTDSVFDSNTEAFNESTLEFQAAAKDVLDKLERLNSIVDSINTAIQVVDIVDEVIATAAALAKF